MLYGVSSATGKPNAVAVARRKVSNRPMTARLLLPILAVLALGTSGGIAACAPRPASVVSDADIASWTQSMTGLWSVTMTDGSGKRRTGQMCVGPRALAGVLASWREPPPPTCTGRRELRNGVLIFEQICRTRIEARTSFESHTLSIAGPKAFNSTMDGRMLGGDAADPHPMHMAMAYARLGACPASAADGQLVTDDGRTIDMTGTRTRRRAVDGSH